MRDVLIAVATIAVIALGICALIFFIVIPQVNANNRLNDRCEDAGGQYVRVYNSKYECLEVRVLNL